VAPISAGAAQMDDDRRALPVGPEGQVLAHNLLPLPYREVGAPALRPLGRGRTDRGGGSWLHDM
jgi:hypothetical protein